MVSIYETQQGRLHECEHICPGTWVDLCAPTEEELAHIGATLSIDTDLLRAALDG